MKLLIVICIIVIALLCLSGCKNSNTTGEQPVVSISGKVVRVLDGDTIKIHSKNDDWVYTVRLYGIDAPEKKQPYGREAQRYLMKLIDDREVTAIIRDKDKYGRYIATVVYNDVDINAEMIKAGLAWYYSRYSINTGYAELMHRAIGEKKGLWQDEAPIKPENFRYKP